jgi:hypothetical protein
MAAGHSRKGIVYHDTIAQALRLHAKSPASSGASEPDHAASANRDPDNHGFVTFLLSLTNRPRDGQL